LNQQYRSFEAKNMNLTSEMEDLKRELHQAAKKHEDAVSIIRETH